MPEPTTDPPRQRRSSFTLVAQLASLILVGGLLGLLVYSVVISGHGAAVVAAVRKGKKPKAPHFDLKVIWRHPETWPRARRRLVLADHLSSNGLRGMPVVINFWASWCVPCKREAPQLVASAQKHRGKVLFLGVDVQDFTGDARRFLRGARVNYPSVRDGTSSTYGDYGLTGVPETYWVNARGRIVAHYAGEISRDQLEDGIEEAVIE